MVKNIPTIERSTKIRFGKHANDNQAENTVVFNASDAPISASTPGSLYVTPVRVAELSGANFFAYHAQTAELVDSGVATDLLGGITLENATTVGNVTANTVEFNNVTTSFVASSNVGISNTLPTHALSVADKVFIKGPVGDNDDLRIVGNTRTDRLSTTGDSVVIDRNNTNKIQVSGIIHTGDIQATSHVAIANTNPQNLFTLGAVGQTVMNVPTQSVFAIETTGNINAQYYRGDGGLLSNVTLQTVTDKSNITSNTLHLTNPTTSLKAYSNIVIDDYIFGNISGSNLITASQITAQGHIQGQTTITAQGHIQGQTITALGDIQGQTITGTQGVYDQIVTSQDILADKLIGTTGIYGEILGSNNITAAKVSGILYGEIVGSNNIASSGIYGEILGSNNISASIITASSLSGDGSSITDIDTGNITMGTLAIPVGGTGIDAYTEGDLVYANGITSLAKLSTSSATAGQFLRLNAGKTAPEWSDVPLTLDEVLASQTGVSNVSNEVITLNKSSGVVLEVTDGQVALNGSGIVLDASSGDILASNFQGAFSGNGSGITDLNLGQANNSGQVPIARGGTGASSLSGSSIPYVNSSGIFEESKIGYNPSTHITSISSNVVISGNLTVAGNITAQHTTDHYITDKIFAVAHNNTTDAKDMGQHMTRPTANVFAGFLGQTMSKEYTIAFTESNSESETVVPTNTTADGYITANVWGNVLSGNVTTTGKVTADNLNLTGTGTIINASNGTISAQAVNSTTFTGANFVGGSLSGGGPSITNLNLGHASHTGQLLTIRGGTGVTTGISVLNPANLSSQVLLAKGGTGLTSIAQNELLLGPASGDVLTKLTPYTGPAAVTVPVAMTANSSGGNTASSGDSSANAFKAFDGSDITHYVSSTSYLHYPPYGYTASNSLGGVNGDWLKIQLASAFAPTSVFVKARPDGTGFAVRPNSWRIMGSTDGTNWTQLHSSTTLVDSSSGTTESFTNTISYTYLGIVVTNISLPGLNDRKWTLSHLLFSGPGSGPSEKFLRSSAAGIVWDEVSSTLQTITDGGATTTQTVAFNNTTTGLTSAGDIDIAATKQIDYAGDVLLKSSAGAVASLKVTNAVKLDPVPFASATVPVAMTANSSGGNTASAGYGSTNAWKAFDGSDSTTYTGETWAYNPSTDSYNSTNSLGGISGDWLKIQLASAIIPISVFLKSVSIPNSDASGRPDEWRILGSNDDTNWTQIHSSTTEVTNTGTTESFINTTAYSYIAIVVTSITQPGMGGYHWALSRLSFTASPPPSNNVLSFNTTTGEIYDSGGQGGSSLDNIHEEGSNVAIGPSAASANLTINTYGSNVLTVSGNVSADNITIGTLHVSASPFALDDVVSVNAGANVTSNVIQFTGPHSSYNSDNAFVTTNSIKIGSNVNVTGNLISQNIQLTNPGITATMSSTDTITIDAKNKSYGTGPLVQLAGDLNSFVYSNLIDGAQVVIPIFASGADRKISKNLTNVNWYVQTSDLTIKQNDHGLMTLSNVAGNVYMNSISFTQN